MTDEPVASALRQEGPQQAIEQLPRYAYGMTELPAGLPRATMFPAPRSGEWLKRSDVLAALSASRTAQAPQQERKVCNCWLGTDSTFGSSTVRQACQVHGDAAEIARLQARIQVLATSVDYLRYLVDHPVENKGGANQGQSTAKTPMIPDGLSENVNHLRGAQAQSSTADPPVAPAEGEALQREKGE